MEATLAIVYIPISCDLVGLSHLRRRYLGISSDIPIPILGSSCRAL